MLSVNGGNVAHMHAADLAAGEFWGWTPYSEAHACSKNVWLIHTFIKHGQYFCFVSILCLCPFFVQFQHDRLFEVWDTRDPFLRIDFQLMRTWQRAFMTFLFVAHFFWLVCICFKPQGDMGEDGPKGDMGEKVSEQPVGFCSIVLFVVRERNLSGCYNDICCICFGWIAQLFIQAHLSLWQLVTYKENLTRDCRCEPSFIFFP